MIVGIIIVILSYYKNELKNLMKLENERLN